MKKILAIAASVFVTLSFSSCGLVSGLLNSSENSGIDPSKGTPVTTEQANAAFERIKTKYEAFKANNGTSNMAQYDKATIKETVTQDDGVMTLTFAYSKADQYAYSESTHLNSKVYTQAKYLFENPENPEEWVNRATFHNSKTYNYRYIDIANNYIAATDDYVDASTLDLTTKEMKREETYKAYYTSNPFEEGADFWETKIVNHESFNLFDSYMMQFEAAMIQLQSFIPTGLINLGDGMSMNVVSNGENHLYCEYNMPLVGTYMAYEFENGVLTYYKSSMEGSILTESVTATPYKKITTEYHFYPDVCDVKYPNLGNFEKTI